MRLKSETPKIAPEQVVKNIRRATRKHHSAEEKIRIVLEGLRGELAKHAGKVRLVAVSGASNVTGAVNPVHEIARLAHHRGELRAHQRRRPQGRPAREVAVSQFREQVEALGLSRDRLGHHLARDAGQRDAVPRESLQVVHIRFKPSEVRRPVHGDVHVAAPGVFDARIP